MKSLSSKLGEEEGRASETLTVGGASDSGKSWKQAAAAEEERWRWRGASETCPNWTCKCLVNVPFIFFLLVVIVVLRVLDFLLIKRIYAEAFPPTLSSSTEALQNIYIYLYIIFNKSFFFSFGVVNSNCAGRFVIVCSRD